jgi:preprotein translocase subunit SecG
MSTLITVLIIITSILLILVVLVQNSKGGGLASQFSASNQVMGVKKTTEVIEKITWGLAIGLLLFCMALSFVIKAGSTGAAKDTELRDKIERAANAKPLQGVPDEAQRNATPVEDMPAGELPAAD